MKITEISVWQKTLPLIKPYWLSGGRLKFEALDSTFVRIDTDAGIFGWGEGCPWGHSYLPAHGPGVRAAIETLAPALIGQNPCALEHINRVMDRCLPGHQYAKSPLDIACWDILGKTTSMPLWHLLGDYQANPVPLNSSISTGNPQEMVALIHSASAAGYRVHSAKIGGNNAATDIERINTIVAALPDGESVTFDINRAWTPATAIQVLNSVNAISWVEQPCESLDQCTLVAQRVRQPILLDECLHNIQDHFNAWKGASCAGVKIKPNRLGGLSKAKKMLDFGISIGWQMHVEDVGGSALADTVAIHLASATPAENRLASWLSHAHLAVDPVAGQGSRNQLGFATPPDLPGHGVIPDPDQLGVCIASYDRYSA